MLASAVSLSRCPVDIVEDVFASPSAGFAITETVAITPGLEGLAAFETDPSDHKRRLGFAVEDGFATHHQNPASLRTCW